MKKDFHITHEDEREFTLQHPDGHHLKIAKAGLSEGSVKKIRGFSCGGKVPGYYDGVEVPPNQDLSTVAQDPYQVMTASNEPNSIDARTGQPYYASAGAPPKPHNFTDPEAMHGQTGTGRPDQINRLLSDTTAYPEGSQERENLTSELNQKYPQAAPMPTPQPLTETTKPRLKTPLPTAGSTQKTAVPNPIEGLDDPYTGMRNAQESYLGGMGNEAAAIGQQGQAEAGIKGAEASGLNQINQNFIKESTDINNHINQTIKEVHDGTIDVNRVWTNKDVGDKVGSIIGMILGGAGSGLTGQPNAALEMLNKEIDRDIESQKESLGNKKTALDGFMKQYGNLRDATTALRANLVAMTSAQIEREGYKYKGAIAGARATQNAALFLNQNTASLYDMGIRRSMQKMLFDGMRGSNNGQRMPPEMAIRRAGLMGASEATQTKMYDELKEAEHANRFAQNALDSWDKVDQMVLGGEFDKGKRDALLNPVLGELAKNSFGRFTENDYEVTKALLPNKIDNLKVWSDTRATKREQFVNIISNKLSWPLLRGWMVPPPQLITDRNAPPKTTGNYNKEVAVR